MTYSVKEPALPRKQISVSPASEDRNRSLARTQTEPSVQIRVEQGADGSVRLEEMGYSRSAGWHVRKSLRIPAEQLAAVLLELRKADCLNPKCPRRIAGSIQPNRAMHLRLTE
jgi:hypothetical protein